MWYTVRMNNEQMYALGIIMSSHSCYEERGYRILKVRRASKHLTLACMTAFGGRHYKKSGGAYTWILRGKPLESLIHQLDLRGMHL